jgi:hypothetical protein
MSLKSALARANENHHTSKTIDHQPLSAPASSNPIGAAMQVWTGNSIESEIQTKPVAEIFQRWRSLDKKKLPRLRDIFLIRPSLNEDVFVSMRINGSDFIIVSQSANHIKRIGHDLRGRLYSELKISCMDAVKSINETCFASKEAVYSRFICDLSEKPGYWESICFPLSADDNGRPMFVLNGVAELNEKTDLLQHLYDRSPVAMIIAIPTMNAKEIGNARILSLNNLAKKILGAPGHDAKFHCVADLGPWLRDVLKWQRVEAVSQDRQNKITYKDEAGSDYVMTIEWINHFILVSIAPPRGLSFAYEYAI